MILYEKKLTLEWDDISKFRDFFTDLMNQNKHFNKDKTSIIIMVISELLENVVKYTSNKSCYLKIWIKKLSKGNSLNVSLENDFSSVLPKDFINLVQIVKLINSYEDYEQMYLEFAQKFINDPNGKSQFGMALIRKLIEGNPIIIKKGSNYKKGFEIKLSINL